MPHPHFGVFLDSKCSCYNHLFSATRIPHITMAKWEVFCLTEAATKGVSERFIEKVVTEREDDDEDDDNDNDPSK